VDRETGDCSRASERCQRTQGVSVDDMGIEVPVNALAWMISDRCPRAVVDVVACPVAGTSAKSTEPNESILD
jgi:hypothetical protein